MRIGLITGEYAPLRGGLADYTHILGTTLVEQGHEVFILSNTRTQQQHDKLPVANIINKWRPTTISDIRGWIADKQIDIVNLQFQTAAYDMSPWIHFLPHVLDVPFVTTFHDLRFPYLFPKAGALRTWIVEHLAVASDGAIVTNSADYDQLTHLDNIETIRIGSNITPQLSPDYDRQDTRQSLGITDDDFLLGFFGLVNHTKGLDTLLEALRDAISSGLNAKLLIIGGDTGASDPTNAAYLQQIEQQISDLNFQDDIIRTGYVDDAAVSAYLSACDLIALPFRDGVSYRRGSLMAAIQHECAIITTNPSTPDAGLDDEHFLLVEPNNPIALSQAIQMLSASPDLQQTLRTNVATLKPQFSWDVTAEQTTQFFERVIGITK